MTWCGIGAQLDRCRPPLHGLDICPRGSGTMSKDYWGRFRNSAGGTAALYTGIRKVPQNGFR